MSNNCKLRTLSTADQGILWEMLKYAAHETSIASVKSNIDLVRYAQHWGRFGDVGTVAEQADQAIGAAWLRLWPTEDKGYGYIDSETPELAIAVLPSFRGQGIGTKLLKQTLLMAQKQFSAVSLSIRADNPALRLYQRIGFVPVKGSEVTNRTGGKSFSMLYSFKNA